MSLDRIKETASQILNRSEAAKGKSESTTIQTLILPMIAALGYDVWDPNEVIIEYEADLAIIRKGQKEKVDIAILQGGQPIIFVEAKASGTNLDGHQGQLAKYFQATPSVVLGILTNGLEWRFFTDTVDDNVMDPSPFHVSKLDASDQGLEVMHRFSKGQQFAETIGDYAADLLYTEKIAIFLKNEIDLKSREPSEYFVRWILKGEDLGGKPIYSGSFVTANIVTRFQPIVKTALARINREIARRSLAAFDDEAAKESEPVQYPATPAPVESPKDAEETGLSAKRTINTTEDELTLFEKIKAIHAESPSPNREVYEPVMRKFVPAEIGYKDTTAYFGIYINKPSWWFIRAYVESSYSKWIGFNIPADEIKNLLHPDLDLMIPSAHAETRVAINGIDDIEKLTPVILAAFNHEVLKHQSRDEGKSE